MPEAEDLRAGSWIDVEVRETSSFLAGLDLPQVRLMKIDVEGHEDDVLEGGAEFLERAAPDVVLFESNDRTLPFWSRRGVRQIVLSTIVFSPSARVYSSPVSCRSATESNRRVEANDYLAIHPREFDSIAAALGVASSIRGSDAS